MSGVVHFKFRGTNQYEQVQFDGHFVKVSDLKRLIAEKKGLGRDGAAGLRLYESTGTVEFADEEHQLSKHLKVIVRRGPAIAPRPLVGATPMPVASAVDAAAAAAPVAAAPAEPAAAGDGVDDNFGGDVYAYQADQAAAMDADLRRVAAVGEAEARLQQQAAARDACGAGRAGCAGGRGSGGPSGRGGEGRRGGPPGPRLAPPTWHCQKCAGFGHWPTDCPALEDPSLEVRRIRPAAGIPVAMLRRNPDGSLVLPDGGVGALAPDPRAFEAATAAYRPAPVHLPPAIAPPSAPSPTLRLLAPQPTRPVPPPAPAAAPLAILPAAAAAAAAPPAPRNAPCPPAARPPVAAELFPADNEPVPSSPPSGDFRSLALGMLDPRPARRPSERTRGRSPPPLQRPPPPLQQHLGELMRSGALPVAPPRLLLDAFGGPRLSREQFERVQDNGGGAGFSGGNGGGGSSDGFIGGGWGGRDSGSGGGGGGGNGGGGDVPPLSREQFEHLQALTRTGSGPSGRRSSSRSRERRDRASSRERHRGSRSRSPERAARGGCGRRSKRGREQRSSGERRSTHSRKQHRSSGRR